MSVPLIMLNSSPAICCGEPTGWCADVELARIGLGVGDQLGKRFGPKPGAHSHHHRKANESANRYEVAQEVEFEMMIEGGVDAVEALTRSSV